MYIKLQEKLNSFSTGKGNKAFLYTSRTKRFERKGRKYKSINQNWTK